MIRYTETAHWVYAVAPRAGRDYPEHTIRGGKWMIFVDAEERYEIWRRVCNTLEDGLLGYFAKMSLTPRDGRHVICIYTSDSRDVSDIKRIRRALDKHVGIDWPIGYKTDEATRKGLYGREHWLLEA